MHIAQLAEIRGCKTMVLNRGDASPGGAKKFPGEREPFRALKHKKFLREVFRTIITSVLILRRCILLG